MRSYDEAQQEASVSDVAILGALPRKDSALLSAFQPSKVLLRALQEKGPVRFRSGLRLRSNRKLGAMLSDGTSQRRGSGRQCCRFMFPNLDVGNFLPDLCVCLPFMTTKLLGFLSHWSSMFFPSVMDLRGICFCSYPP